MDNETYEEYVNQTELAEFLGISTRRIRDLQKEGIIVKNEQNMYSLKDNYQSYLEYRQEYEESHRMGAERKADLEELNRLKAEHEKIKMEISRIRLGRMQGTLVSSKNFETFLTVKFNNLVRQLEELPAKIAFATAGMEQDEAIQTANEFVQSVLDDFQKWPDGNDYNFEEPCFDYLDDEDDEDDDY